MAKLAPCWQRLLDETDLPHLVPGLEEALTNGAPLSPRKRAELLREIDAYSLGDEIPDFFLPGEES